MKIKGVLFDSGDTLVFPKGGSWWPGPDFQSIIRNHEISQLEISEEKMRIALREGEKCFNVNHLILDCEEEKEQFRIYYRVICRYLGYPAEDEKLIDDLACAYVDGCNIELYPDTVETLNRLKTMGVTLGVLSDAWPSLERKFSVLGIRGFFASFTISAKVGCYKPAEKMYQTAVRDIGIEAEALIFLDNDIDNVRAAMRLGMKGLVMCRDNNLHIPGAIPVISELREIFAAIS